MAGASKREPRALYQHILQHRPVRPVGAPLDAASPGPASPSPEGLLPAGALAAEAPLVGRDVELARLRDALRSALAGQGARILLGRCYETEQVLSLGGERGGERRPITDVPSTRAFMRLMLIAPCWPRPDLPLAGFRRVADGVFVRAS